MWNSVANWKKGKTTNKNCFLFKVLSFLFESLFFVFFSTCRVALRLCVLCFFFASHLIWLPNRVEQVEETNQRKEYEKKAKPTHKKLKVSFFFFWLLAHQVRSFIRCFFLSPLHFSLFFLRWKTSFCCLHEYLINLLICNMYSHNSWAPQQKATERERVAKCFYAKFRWSGAFRTSCNRFVQTILKLEWKTCKQLQLARRWIALQLTFIQQQRQQQQQQQQQCMPKMPSTELYRQATDNDDTEWCEHHRSNQQNEWNTRMCWCLCVCAWNVRKGKYIEPYWESNEIQNSA